MSDIKQIKTPDNTAHHLKDYYVWDGVSAASIGDVLIKTGNNTIGWETLSGSSGVFWCTFDETTYSEVETAITNGQLPVLYYDDSSASGEVGIYVCYGRWEDDYEYSFKKIDGDTICSIFLGNDDTWTVDTPMYLQQYISDLSTIRSGATAGTNAVPKTGSTAMTNTFKTTGTFEATDFTLDLDSVTDATLISLLNDIGV